MRKLFLPGEILGPFGSQLERVERPRALRALHKYDAGAYLFDEQIADLLDARVQDLRKKIAALPEIAPDAVLPGEFPWELGRGKKEGPRVSAGQGQKEGPRVSAARV